jgi:hypothetical protein
MTTFDRFDPLERRIGAAMDDIAGTRPLDYLDDVFRQTARTVQRPRWSFPERWLNVDTTLVRPAVAGRRLPFRSLIVLVALAALLATAAFYVGTQKRLPPPYGPAGNGQLVYAADGDLYVRDTLTSAQRLLLGGPGEQSGAVISPDGQLIAYDNYYDVDEGGNPRPWVANLDGSNPRRVLERGYTFETFEWAADSRSMAIVTRPGRLPELWIVPAEGSGAQRLEFESFFPSGATWDPLRPGVLLVRGEDKETHLTDLYYVSTDGRVLQKFGLRTLNLNGPAFELSGLAFAPDGQTIAFNDIVAKEYPVNRFRAHLMHRDGTNVRVIAAPLQTGFSQAWPQFSPDGKWVALDTWETMVGTGVRHQLAIAPSDGSAPARRIGPIVQDDQQIKSWSPDGSRILLCACEARELYTIDPLSGDFEKLPWQGDLPGWQRLAK